MPWTKGDVERHIKGLKDKQKEAWVKIANSTLAACQKKGGTDCEGRAVRIANAMAPKTTEELEVVKELIEIVGSSPPPWKIDDVDSYVKDLPNAQKKMWVKIANTIHNHCHKAGGDDCYSRATKMATAVVPIIKENIEELEGDKLVDKITEIYNGTLSTAKQGKEIKEGVDFIDVIEGFTDIEVIKENNIIKNVCIIAKESKNNRIYSDKAINDIVMLAEGVKSYADHPVKGMVRSVKALIGQLENTRRVDGKGYADLKVLSSNKDWLFPLAEELPNIAGMSIIARGKIASEKDEKGRDVVESVHELKSVDLVSEPATTKSIFEYIEPDGSKNKKEDEHKMEKITKEQWDAMTIKDIQDNKLDIYEKIKNSEELVNAKKELDELKAKEAVRTKSELMEKLITDSELPKEAITDLFKDTLMKVDEKVVDDERVTIKEQMKKLIADRLIIVKSGKVTGSGDEKNVQTEEVSDEEIVGAVKGKR